MTREMKLMLAVVAGVLGYLLIGFDLGRKAPRRAPGPDLVAAYEQCNDERAVLRAKANASDTIQGPVVRPWSVRRPGDKTKRPR